MASIVKRKNPPKQGAISLPDHFCCTAGPHSRRPRRYFLLPMAARRLHDTALGGPSHHTGCLGAVVAGRSLRASETRACPMPTLQSDEVAPLPAAFVRSRFDMRAAFRRDSLLP